MAKGERMTWEEYKRVQPINSMLCSVETDIECPICGKNIFKDMSVVLTSNPPQYRFFCKCGWSEFSC